MAALFDTCLTFTLAQEGGFADNPEDPGGATFKGITLASLREWLKAPNTPVSVLKGLDAVTVAKFYRTQFWDRDQCDIVPAGLDLMLFDFGVNAGEQRPIPMLQWVLGVDDDGIIGPKTLDAIKAWSPQDLIGTVRDAQDTYYRGLRQFGTFGKGWLNRLSRRYTFAIRLAAGTPPPVASIAA